MNDQRQDPVPQTTPPSFAEFAAAMKAMQPAPQMESGIAKHIQTIVVAAALGIGGFVLTGLNSVQTSLATIVQTTTDMQRTVDQISRRQDEESKAMSDVQTTMASVTQRVNSLERRADVQASRTHVIELAIHIPPTPDPQ